MKKCLVLVVYLFMASACNKDKEIVKGLNSSIPTDIIVSAREAGDSGDKKYVPLLLHNAYNQSVSTSLRYDGFSVYTEIMFALQSIYHVKPPHPYSGILISPDSANVKFYTQLWQKAK